MKSSLTIILFVSLAVVTCTDTKGQSSTTSAGQRAAIAMGKVNTDSLTAVNYHQILQRLAIQLPVLPSMADDPNRPKNTIAKNGGGSYTDVQGRSIMRSQWG